MQRSSGRPAAFTLIELLVVISVIIVLASMLMPVAIDSLKRASRVQCASNLKQLGYANVLYVKDNDHFLPCYGHKYADVYYPEFYAPAELVQKYLGSDKVHICPVDPSPETFNWWHLNHPTLTRCSYMWSEHAMTVGYLTTYPSIRDPHKVGLIADGWECPNGWVWTTCMLPELDPPYMSRCDWEHDRGVNMLFADQHLDKVGHWDLYKVSSSVK